MFRSVTSRIVAAFLATLVIVVTVVSFATFSYVRGIEHQKTDNDGHMAARQCAILMNVLDDPNVDLSDPVQYEYYHQVLRDMCIDEGMGYLYAYRVDRAAGTCTYLLAAAADEEEDKEVVRTCSYGAVSHRELTDIEVRALAGDVTQEANEYDNAYGNTLDWVVPVNGLGGDVLAASSYPVNRQRERVNHIVLSIIVPFVLVMLLLLAVELAVLRRYVFRPIRAIAEEMRRFKPDKARDIRAPELPQNDEMRDIADAYAGMAGDISEYLDSIETLTQERLQVSVELDVARRIQLGIVPGHFELARPGLEVAAISRPAREVGGDFYDVVRLDGDRVAVAVGDSSGKGMAVALFMVMVKTMIQEGLTAGDSPATVLTEVNSRICEANPEGMFVTVFACVIDPATGTVTFANAGHTTPLVVGEAARPLKQEIGTLLGLFDDIELVDETVTLAPGESLLVFTDGVTEAVDKDKAFLGDAAFAERLSARAPFASAQSVVDATTQIVDAHAAGHEQFDDLTALALTHTNVHTDTEDNTNTNTPSPTVSAAPAAEKSLPVAGAHELPADITSMDIVKEAIFATGADGPLKRRTTLAVEEAFANVVSYSGATRAWYTVEESPEGFRVTLIDDGDPFDLTTAEAPDPEFEDLEFGGMGMRLVRQLASDVSYRYEDGLNVLTIEVFD